MIDHWYVIDIHVLVDCNKRNRDYMYIVFGSFGKLSWTKATLCYKSIHVIHVIHVINKTTLERSLLIERDIILIIVYIQLRMFYSYISLQNSFVKYDNET